MGSEMKRWALVLITILMFLMLTSCNTVDLVNKESVTEPSSITVTTTIRCVGPVLHVGSGYKIEVVPDNEQKIHFNANIKPVNPPTERPLTISLNVLSKQGYLYDTVEVSWTSSELTKPTPPSASERDQRVIDSYETALAAWPPSKTIAFRIPAYDRDVSAILPELNDGLDYMVTSDWLHSGRVEIEGGLIADLTFDNPPPGKCVVIPISGMQSIFERYLTVSAEEILN